MDQQLNGKRVAILAADGFEYVELMKPREALEKAGAKTAVVSLKPGSIKGFNHFDPAGEVKVDETVDKARCEAFDALLIPGGAHNPDELRGNKRAVEFTREFCDAGKPVASICHGPWVLAEAGVLKGRTVTSWPSIQTDLKNAGAEWVDKEVVVDNGIVTSRKPDDIPAFNRKMIEEIAEGVHPRS